MMDTQCDWMCPLWCEMLISHRTTREWKLWTSGCQTLDTLRRLKDDRDERPWLCKIAHLSNFLMAALGSPICGLKATQVLSTTGGLATLDALLVERNASAAAFLVLAVNRLVLPTAIDNDGEAVTSADLAGVLKLT